jgi:DNA-binding beta-propeller fold protein YncE
MKLPHLLGAALVALWLAVPLPADDKNESKDDAPAKEAAAKEEAEEEAPPEADVKVVLAKLDNPSGVAIQPETGLVFVSDSAAGRIISLNPASSEQPKVVVKGFPQDDYGKGPIYKIGPLGLLFLDKDTLVVGGGELKDGSELVRIYDISSGKTLAMDDMKHKLGPIGPGEQSAKGEGNFYALAATKTAIYVTSNGDDTKGWVVRIPLQKGEPGDLEPFIATKLKTETVDAPVGITMNRNGQIVVGQMGEVNVPTDSLFTVYDPESGELMHEAETGLYDIAGLAYSPKTEKLYAVDYAWMEPSKGGLFRLDIDENATTLKAVKIATLERPSALAFTPDGELYVTLFGGNDDGTKKKEGKLVRVLGDL